MRTQKRGDLAFRWRFHPRWQVRGALGKGDDVFYAAARPGRGGRQEQFAEAGIDYVVPSVNTIGVVMRRSNGSYPDPLVVDPFAVSNDYDQNELRACTGGHQATPVQWRNGVA